MINGFEEETGPLSTEEISLVPRLIKGFSHRIGEKNAITSDQIIYKLKAEGHKMSGPRLRKIVNHIRTKKILVNLIATSKGYYIETDPDKIRDYIDSLKARANAIMAVANSYL